ncbi:MAG: hypothetical protein L0H73_09320 [Nitrococcus sp.]|nr:hypothetical protein [Nitrococcus sp.]
MASIYANFGSLMETRGDPDEARVLWVKARDLFTKLGAEQKVSMVQGWIDGLPS